MAEIGNLSVRLTLDANAFNGSLKQVDTNLRSMQSELKAVKAKGREYNQTVDGMKERQEVLNRALSASGVKLQEARREYDRLVQSGKATEQQLAEQARRVNQAQAEYNRFEEELRYVTRQLNEQTNAFKQTSKRMKELGDSVASAGDKLKVAGQGLSTYVTAPLVGLGAAAIAAASEVADASASIQTDLDLTASEAAELNKTAKQVWKEGFGESLKSVASNVAAVTKSLGELSEVDLTYVTKGLEIFESKGWGDQRETLRAMKVLMEQFGLSSKKAMDYLTKGFQENLDYSGEFLDTVSEYSVYFAELGFDVDDMFSKLKAGADAGVFQLDKVG